MYAFSFFLSICLIFSLFLFCIPTCDYIFISFRCSHTHNPFAFRKTNSFFFSFSFPNSSSLVFLYPTYSSPLSFASAYPPLPFILDFYFPEEQQRSFDRRLSSNQRLLDRRQNMIVMYPARQVDQVIRIASIA